MVKKFGLTNNQLKLLAMLAMLCDHAGKVLLPQYTFLQIIGRIAFPIFAFMVAEGCFYTRNKIKYFLSVFLLGVGCQAVFFIAERSFYQNILITFSLSVALIFVLENYKNKRNKPSLAVMFFTVALVLTVTVAFPALFKAQGFYVDYGIWGVLLPVAVFYAPDKERKLLFATGMLILLAFSAGSRQWFSLLAVPLLALYNQKRGKYNIKPLFYIFYPAHLAAIHLISLLLQ